MILPPKETPAHRIDGLLRERFTFKESPAIDDSPVLAAETVARSTANTRELSVAEPQAIYTSSIDALLQGQLLEKAYRSGWQYVLISDDEPQGVIEVSEKPAAGPPTTFDVLRAREYAEAMNAVMLRAEQIEGQYDLRVLRVPALYLLAIWLQAGRKNLLLPIVPPSSKALMGGIFSEGELRKRLEPFARKRRDIPDSGRGPNKRR